MTFRDDINALTRKVMRGLITSHPKFDMRREYEMDRIYKALSLPKSVYELAEELDMAQERVEERLIEMRDLDMAQEHRVYWVRR